MRFLVTGAAGFLGSHLCERLLAEGHEVFALDNLVTGSKDNLQSCLQDIRFEFILHDVCNPIDLEIDAIFNLACPASPVSYQLDPIKTTKTTVLGMLNLLELAHQLNIPILQASTSEVYGDPEVHPQTESYWGNVNPIGLRSCYDEGKRCAEALCFDYYRQLGVSIKVARIFNTYGPRMQLNDGRVVSNFIIQALRGEKITIYGTGSQTRSFCYVDDLIEGLWRLMSSPPGFTGPVNLGRPVEFTMLELAELVKEITGSPSELEFRPLPHDDPKKRLPDIGLAIENLGWEPKISLRDGLEKTIPYFDALVEKVELIGNERG